MTSSCTLVFLFFCLFFQRTFLDAGSRQESTTAKKPTGPYDRERLLRHMHAEAGRSTVGNNWLVYNGEKKGKPFEQAKQEKQARAPSKKLASDSTGDPELDALLAGVEGLATDKDFEDLAGKVQVLLLTCACMCVHYEVDLCNWQARTFVQTPFFGQAEFFIGKETAGVFLAVKSTVCSQKERMH